MGLAGLTQVQGPQFSLPVHSRTDRKARDEKGVGRPGIGPYVFLP